MAGFERRIFDSKIAQEPDNDNEATVEEQVESTDPSIDGESLEKDDLRVEQLEAYLSGRSEVTAENFNSEDPFRIKIFERAERDGLLEFRKQQAQKELRLAEFYMDSIDQAEIIYADQMGILVGKTDLGNKLVNLDATQKLREFLAENRKTTTLEESQQWSQERDTIIGDPEGWEISDQNDYVFSKLAVGANRLPGQMSLGDALDYLRSDYENRTVAAKELITIYEKYESVDKAA